MQKYVPFFQQNLKKNKDISYKKDNDIITLNTLNRFDAQSLFLILDMSRKRMTKIYFSSLIIIYNPIVNNIFI